MDWQALQQRAVQQGIEQELALAIAAALDRQQQLAQQFSDFHWGDDVSGYVQATHGSESVLWQLGELRSVVYRARKDGRLFDWHHDFRRHRPLLCSGEDPSQLYIVGGGYTVSARGIVG